jgi:hypothetical protein
MPVTNPNPPVLVPKPLNDGPLPTAPEPDNPPQGVVTLFTGFTEGLVGTLVGKGGELASVYRELADREGMVKWFKQVYDSVGQTVNRTTLIWEGPEGITAWPTDVTQQVDATAQLIAALKAKGMQLDPFVLDKAAYLDGNGTMVAVDSSTVFGTSIPHYDRAALIGPDLWGKYSSWSDLQVIATFGGNAKYWYFPDGKLYYVGVNSSGQRYKTEVRQLASNPSSLSLQLYGAAYAAETDRLRAAGMPVTRYDAYQYSLGNGSKTGYTLSNQILTRDTADFSGIPDGTIVAVAHDYYLVANGAGQKLDGPPKGLLTGLPGNASPSADARYRNAIASTSSLTMGGLSLVAGDYDMCLYAYGGGQVGHAKLPPVVVSTDPRNGGLTGQPPGTLLQYTDARNHTGYYRVTGPGTVAAVEDPAAIAKVVTGNPPDLSAIDAGTLVKLDDGKLYWVAKDKSTVPADGAPLLRFLSPERKANWDGIQVTEALLEAGIRLEDSDMDTCVYIDRDGSTVFAKLPAKVFDGPGDAPDGKNYAPGDVIESADGSHAWYIDAQGQAQEAKSRITVKEVVSPDAFDPTKYDPGTVVGIEGGDYYRITTDHQAVRISYPLEKLICNPSEVQISSIQGKLKDLMNEKNTNMQGLMIRLQKLAGDQNWLATLIMGIVSMMANVTNSVARNMA